MGQLSQAVKQPGHEADQSFARSSENMNAWRYTSTTLMPGYTAAILPFLYFLFIIISRKKKRFIFFVLLRRTGINHTPFHVGFMVDNVALA
jgi:hypothetical protein